MGRLASIQPVTSAILKTLSHWVIVLKKGGPFYSIYDWLKHAETEQIGSVILERPLERLCFTYGLLLTTFRVLSRASGPLFRCLSSAFVSPPIQGAQWALLRIPESAARVRGLQNFDEACSSILRLCLRSIKVRAGMRNTEHPQSFWLTVAARSRFWHRRTCAHTSQCEIYMYPMYANVRFRFRTPRRHAQVLATLCSPSYSHTKAVLNIMTL